jgi:Flp pilus assembly protein TadD
MSSLLYGVKPTDLLAFAASAMIVLLVAFGASYGPARRALKLDPQNYHVHYLLAKAYQRLGRAADAKQHFEICESLKGEQSREERSLLQPDP